MIQNKHKSTNMDYIYILANTTTKELRMVFLIVDLDRMTIGFKYDKNDASYKHKSGYKQVISYEELRQSKITNFQYSFKICFKDYIHEFYLNNKKELDIWMKALEDFFIKKKHLLQEKNIEDRIIPIKQENWNLNENDWEIDDIQETEVIKTEVKTEVRSFKEVRETKETRIKTEQRTNVGCEQVYQKNCNYPCTCSKSKYFFLINEKILLVLIFYNQKRK